MAMHDITEYTQKLADTFTKQGNIADVESTSTASKAYAVDEFLIYGGQFYKVTTAIAQGDTIVTTGAGANVEATKVTDEMGGGGPTSGVLLADGTVPADNLTIGSRATGSTVGTGSFAHGVDVEASGDNSRAGGSSVVAASYDSTEDVRLGILASGAGASAEGIVGNGTAFIHAGGQGAHAEGYANTANKGILASGNGAHAEGNNTTAIGNASHAEGVYTTARGAGSHAEGQFTLANGILSHAEGWNTATQDNASAAHAEGNSNVLGSYNSTTGTRLGIYAGGVGSHAEGRVSLDTSFIHATGQGAHAEGCANVTGEGILASGDGSHAEGVNTTASSKSSHAEGFKTTANGIGAHAEGRSSVQGTASVGIYVGGDGGHAEGYTGNETAFIRATGYGAHAEGFAGTAGIGILASGGGAHAEGTDTTASGPSAHAEGNACVAEATANNGGAHAEGVRTKAAAVGSHAEGYSTPTSGASSSVGIYTSGAGAHAEGYVSNATAFIRATGQGAHAEGVAAVGGYGVLASGDGSHAEGYQTTASGAYSHAEGDSTTASALYAHAEGKSTTAGLNNHAQGHYNKAMTAGIASGGTTGDAMAIGNGTSSSASNAFRVTYAGAVYGLSAFNSSGADYAEFFEWADGNENEEDRVGLFVTLDGDKIKTANSGDYILGIISGQPSVVGNGDEDWLGRWQRDDFGRFVWGDIEVKNPETKKMETVNTMLPNPDYDNTQTYVERKDRKEWDYVGMLGTLAVRDNGKCEVNGYCACGENGIAVPAENGYRVIKRVSENVIKVIVK